MKPDVIMLPVALLGHDALIYKDAVDGIGAAEFIAQRAI